MKNLQWVTLTAVILILSACGGDGNSSSKSGNNSSAAGSTTGARVLEFSTTITDARPEMLGWWWDNLNPERFERWDESSHVAFSWLELPATPQHLGASEGARYESTEIVADEPHHLSTKFLPTPSDSADGMFLAQVNSDQLGAYRLQHRYWATGSEGRDTLVTTRIEFDRPPGVLLQRELQTHISNRLQNLGDFLQGQFQTEFIERELRSRGSFRLETDGPVTRVIVDHVIENLRPEHVNWWWDNINTSARYRRWHPTAHISFEWTRAPQQPDEEYDEDAAAEIVETLGPYTTRLEVARAPKADAADQVELDHWVNLRTRLLGIQENGVDVIIPFPLPDQSLVHEWGQADMQMQTGPNGEEMLVLHSVFETPTYAPPGFHEGLGWHAIEEFQMLQYFLPQLYEREFGSAGK